MIHLRGSFICVNHSSAWIIHLRESFSCVNYQLRIKWHILKLISTLQNKRCENDVALRRRRYVAKTTLRCEDDVALRRRRCVAKTTLRCEEWKQRCVAKTKRTRYNVWSKQIKKLVLKLNEIWRHEIYL
jgi:hypothetical protein